MSKPARGGKPWPARGGKPWDLKLQTFRPVLPIATYEVSLSGRLVSSVEVKATGDVLHEIFAYKPHHLASGFPDIIQNVVLVEGSWGTAGSVVFGSYTLDGRKQVIKSIIDAVDSSKKSITYKLIEGDLLQLYRTVSITIRVDTHDGNNSVTWIMDYVKQSPNVPDPNSLMDMFYTLTKGIDSHHAN
ncbi:hypothetical protein ACH5RR_029972 [Cinchona calisaya]|uniref:Bet v I/Major latex protein domain-containing protein n=1 Tax=Cinchona calisaya TaxID=153742 RepID=A0ABD2YUN9_9GENT